MYTGFIHVTRVILYFTLVWEKNQRLMVCGLKYWSEHSNTNSVQLIYVCSSAVSLINVELIFIWFSHMDSPWTCAHTPFFSPEEKIKLSAKNLLSQYYGEDSKYIEVRMLKVMVPRGLVVQPNCAWKWFSPFLILSLLCHFPFSVFALLYLSCLFLSLRLSVTAISGGILWCH